MTNQEKIRKIREIYSNFLVRLGELIKIAKHRRHHQTKAVEQEKIDQLLNRINKEF